MHETLHRRSVLQYRPTELTAILVALRNCLLREDWPHMCKLLKFSTGMANYHHEMYNIYRVS